MRLKAPLDLHPRQLSETILQLAKNPRKDPVNCLMGHAFENALTTLSSSFEFSPVWYYDLLINDIPVDAKTSPYPSPQLIVQNKELVQARKHDVPIVYVLSKIVFPKGIKKLEYLCSPNEFEFDMVSWALSTDEWTRWDYRNNNDNAQVPLNPRPIRELGAYLNLSIKGGKVTVLERARLIAKMEKLTNKGWDKEKIRDHFDWMSRERFEDYFAMTFVDDR